jgi:hypothetical protein
MTLQSSGSISLANVQTEFGGFAPIGINEYYGVAAGVPASGTISLADFYGKSLPGSPAFGGWNTYYIMGDREIQGAFITDSFIGTTITPGDANSPVTFYINTGRQNLSYGYNNLYLYIGGSLASTYTGNNTNVSRPTFFGSNSLQFRSDLGSGGLSGNVAYAGVSVNAINGVTVFRHRMDPQFGGTDD